MQESVYRCHEVYGDIHRHEIAVRLHGDRCLVCSLGGEPLGPVLDERVELSTAVTLLPTRDELIVAQFRGRITAYNWRSGKRLWRVDGYSEVGSIVCSDSDSLIALQLSGECVELDAGTGEELGVLGGVESVAADSMSPMVVLLRRVGRRRSAPERVLEMRGSLSRDTFLHRRPTQMDSLLQSVFGNDWVALSDAGSGSVCMMTSTGEELWRYCTPLDIGDSRGGAARLSSDRYFPCLSRAPDSSWLFGLHLPRVHGMEPEGLLLRASDGLLLHRQVVSELYPTSVAIADGLAMVSPTGLLCLPEMKWSPTVFDQAI